MKFTITGKKLYQRGYKYSVYLPKFFLRDWTDGAVYVVEENNSLVVKKIENDITFLVYFLEKPNYYIVRIPKPLQLFGWSKGYYSIYADKDKIVIQKNKDAKRLYITKIENSQLILAKDLVEKLDLQNSNVDIVSDGDKLIIKKV